MASLETFLWTDLCDDPVMRPMLEACGCGQLFELAQLHAEAYSPIRKPLAAEIRHYLRMAA